MNLGAWDILEGTNFSEYINLGEWDIYLRSRLGLVSGVIGFLLWVLNNMLVIPMSTASSL